MGGVALLIHYGSAEPPWETLGKLWLKNLEEKHFEKLRESWIHQDTFPTYKSLYFKIYDFIKLPRRDKSIVRSMTEAGWK